MPRTTAGVCGKHAMARLQQPPCGNGARTREDPLAPGRSVTRHVMACVPHLAEAQLT
jgi:hypothetical protein